MLHINELTYRIEGRTLLAGARAMIPAGHKVGLVGRNGCGKSTLLRLICGELEADAGSISMPRNARVTLVAQEAPDGPESLLDTVLAADRERASLLREAETAREAARIAEIQLRLVDIDAYGAPARAASILAGLGFDAAAQQRPCAHYSGGWRMRVALAAALFARPDILLLDEPTNYLDLEGSLWLENFIRSYPYTAIIVSHDRDLLNKAVGSILHLQDGRLALYAGGYDRFEETRREQQRLQLKLKKKQDDARRHMEDFVARFRAKATKARQAQSRLKALARLQPISAQIDGEVAPFLFPNPQKRLANPLLRLEAVSVGYAPGQPVLRDINLALDNDDRIGLLGANGNGKSTFAKLLAGRLAPLGGRMKHHKKMQVGYFAQHQLDELQPARSPYDHIAALMAEATEAQKRAKLAALGFDAQKAETPAQHLSGGEKARLLFALAAFAGPHLLILDEPTNHLDVDSREALIHALNAYEGAVILISHDRHLLEATADRLWLVEGGTVRAYNEDIATYRAQLLQQRGAGQRHKTCQQAAEEKPLSRQSRAEERRAAAARRAKQAPLRRELQTVEAAMENLEQEIARIDAQLADSAIYLEAADKAQALALNRGKLAKRLAETEARWLELSEILEDAGYKSA